MNIRFIKLCPLCEHENLPIASFCDACDADLMNALVMRRDEERDEERDEKNDGALLAAKREASTPEDLEIKSIVLPSATPSEAQAKHNRSQNSLLDEDKLVTRRAALGSGGLELELVANPALCFSVRAGQSVGRASKADVVLNDVPELEYISRVHARFIQRRAQWYVQYIAEGNSIAVDGTESRDDAEIALYDESIVVLSFTAFRVRLS